MDETLITQYATEAMQTLERFKRRKIFESHRGLKGGEIFFLMQIATYFDEDELVKPSVLARKMKVTLSAISHHISALEALNLVERVPSVDDRRITFIKLSEEGKKFVVEHQKTFQNRIHAMLNYLGEQDAAELIRIMKRISAFLETDA